MKNQFEPLKKPQGCLLFVNLTLLVVAVGGYLLYVYKPAPFLQTPEQGEGSAPGTVTQTAFPVQAGVSLTPLASNLFSNKDAYINGCQIKSRTICLKVNLAGLDFQGFELDGGDFTGSNFEGANLSRTNLNQTLLRLANLKGANLTFSALVFTNFAGADLTNADLSGANLQKTNLAGANLTAANLKGAQMVKSILTGALFCRTTLPDGTLRTDPGLNC